MLSKCPNCGNSCEVLPDADGVNIGYCDPAILDATTQKPGCDFSFEYKKGKAKSDPKAKGLLVTVTENISYLEKRVADLETITTGKKSKPQSLTPWSV